MRSSYEKLRLCTAPKYSTARASMDNKLQKTSFSEALHFARKEESRTRIRNKFWAPNLSSSKDNSKNSRSFRDGDEPYKKHSFLRAIKKCISLNNIQAKSKNNSKTRCRNPKSDNSQLIPVGLSTVTDLSNVERSKEVKKCEKLSTTRQKWSKSNKDLPQDSNSI